MKKTKYLTDKEPSEFEHLMKPLAEERIKAMLNLKKKLITTGSDLEYGTDEYWENFNRYRAVTDGIVFWRRLLAEE